MQEKRSLLLVLSIGGLLALIAGGVGLWLLNRQPGAAETPEPLPTVPAGLELTLPPSLDELAAQYPDLAQILHDEALASVYKDFLVAYEQGGPQAAEQLARERGLLTDRNEIRMTLVVDSPENVEAVVAELQQYRVTVTTYAQDEINILFSLGALEILAEESGGPETLFAQLTSLEHVIRVKLPVADRIRRFSGQQSVLGEGVRVTSANVWQAAGFEGQGVRVGVLDLGFAGYRALLGSELPAQVQARSFAYGVSDPDATDEPHGTACAEIVYEMAPRAELFLAHYDGSYAGKVQAVDWLLQQGVQVISYSVGTSYGPKDGTGKDAQFVDSVAAEGVLWVSAAGNEADSHYRGVYTDRDGDNWHEFPDGDEVMAMRPFSDFFEVLLQWDDWHVADQDYELHVYDSDFNLIGSSTDEQSGGSGHEPVEQVIYERAVPGDIYYVAIERYAATRPATFDLYAYPAELAYPVAEHSLSSPADARGSFTVGAAEWRDDRIAYYSSRGPTDDGRVKPDIAAPTTVSDVSYGPEGFDGTSAATPHVAGAAALIWSAMPDLSRTEVIDLLERNALDLGPPGPDIEYGYGRLQMPDVQLALAEADGGVQPLPTAPLVPTVASGLAPSSGLAPAEADQSQASSSTALAPTALIGAGLLALVCAGGILFGGGSVLLWRSTRRPSPSLDGTAPAIRDAGAALRGTETRERAPSAPRAAWLETGGTRHDLPVAGFTIGRTDENDLALYDSLVSRKHARIEYASGQWIIRDLGSSNGVYVNEQLVSEGRLQEGDELRLGRSRLRFHFGHEHQR